MNMCVGCGCSLLLMFVFSLCLRAQRKIDSSIGLPSLNKVYLGWVFVNIEGLYFKIKLTFFPEVCFLSKQTAETVMKCHILVQYIWVFTVCNKIRHPHQIQLSTERPHLRAARQHKIPWC